MPNPLRWWQKTTIYHIYPRSFMDSNGDGIGDLPGIISKLGYIQDLGFETIWISPFFASPQADWGYDISDYYGIATEFGTLQDVDELIDAVHTRGMKVLFDLVLNHTSDQHPWFLESRRSRNNPKRDWYIWRDGKSGQRPPNNWKAMPGGRGWQYDEHTDQWYYASFFPFQPDLNYRNLDVKQAMFDVTRFWLDKGVDGFRLDIFSSIYKDAQFRDNPFSPHYVPPKSNTKGFFQRYKHTLNQPETFQLAKDLRAMMSGYKPERMLLGESYGTDDHFRQYLGENLDGLNLVYLWKLMSPKKTARFYRDVIQHYEGNYPEPYRPVYVFGYLDQSRMLSKLGGNLALAKLLALMQFTARGVPITYYGEEIGMTDNCMPVVSSLDPLSKRYAWVPQFLLDLFNVTVNRDNERTPMQWDDSPNAGFTSLKAMPWLPVHENSKECNVRDQESDPDSMLFLYRALLRIREKRLALTEGNLTLMDTHPDVVAYQRIHAEERIVILLNFGNRTISMQTQCESILYSVGSTPSINQDHITLPARAGAILE